MSIRAIIKPILLEVLLSAALFTAFFCFNDYATQSFEAAQGVHWIFIPAGLRIFLTLIFGYTGAVGLALASVIINQMGNYPLDIISILGIGIICGLAPLLGKYLVIHHVKVNADLSNITSLQLLKTIIIFAFLSSVLHQLWFVMRQLESGSWSLFFTMFVGDLIGSIIFIAMIKVALSIRKYRANLKSL